MTIGSLSVLLLVSFCHAATLRGARGFASSPCVTALGATAFVSTSCNPTAAKSTGLAAALGLRGRAGRLLSVLLATTSTAASIVGLAIGCVVVSALGLTSSTLLAVALAGRCLLSAFALGASFALV